MLGLPAIENFAQIEAQQPFLVPFRAVNQNQISETRDDDPARWLGEGEDAGGDNGVKAFGQEGARGRLVGRELAGVQGGVEGIGFLAVEHLQYPQFGRPARSLQARQHR